jgi:hypothetical protein
VIAAAAALASTLTFAVGAADFTPNLLVFGNPSGRMRTFNVKGAIDLKNPFFQDLGTNGRSCVTCHQPGEAWTITPLSVQERFARTNGADPIFRSNDGANCEGVDALDGDRPAAYSLLLSKGLIRVGLDLPDNAEFDVLSVDDPYNCGGPLRKVSVYRRPLPTTNLRFLTAVMWDGRESLPNTGVEEDLLRQANNATRGHAEAVIDLTAEERQQIVEFEMGLASTQTHDNEAGDLGTQGAKGGPIPVAKEPFFIGINDPVGLNPSGAAFNPNVFTLFNAWAGPKSNHPLAEKRRAIARGQEVFNTRPFTIAGVAGLNGHRFPNGVLVPASINGTCTVCHDTPNAGNHSVKAPLNIGLTDASRRTPDLPLYTLVHRTTHEMVETTDPGRAMVTGKWSDIGLFKGPILRALAARAPYFHNGFAATLEDVVDFYDERFAMTLSAQEKSDLVAFLRAL